MSKKTPPQSLSQYGNSLLKYFKGYFQGYKRGNGTPRIVMSFASLGSYRLNTMLGLKRHFGDDLEIYSGDRAPEPSIRLIKSDDLNHVIVKNYILPRAVVIQAIPFFAYLKSGLLVLDLNPRMPFVWVLLILRRLARKRTLLWGHAFPRAGRESRSDIVRSKMRRLSSGVICYTRTQADQLAKIHPSLPIWAAPNALYPREDFMFNEDSVRDSFIYVGRIHSEKKPLLLVEAFEQLLGVRSGLKLVIVGAGPLSEQLTRKVKSSPAADSVFILGHVEDYSVLKTLYSSAIASISPGYVGLSVTQSLSFGVPMIISRTEPHAPEIEAVEEGSNCIFFDTDDVQDLSLKMMEMVENREAWRAKGVEISDACGSSYSVEAMVSGLVDALEDRSS